MAEEEVIILDEEEQSDSSKANEKNRAKVDKEDRKSDRKTLLFAVLLGITTLFLVILLYLFLTKDDSNNKIEVADIAEKFKEAQKKKPLVTQSQLESMIKKANLLYEKGNKKEALKLFEQIAIYSTSISNYNLGVAQMKQEQYNDAIESFKKAIENGENRAISALNAAACSLYLKDEKRFLYYLRLAETYLPESYNSPLYSYMYSIINYYKGNYFEILSALTNPTSDIYKSDLYRLGALSYTVFNRPTKAISLLEDINRPKDYLFLGLLYAKTGNYELSTSFLKKAREEGYHPFKSTKALILVNLKNKRTRSAAKLINELRKDFDSKGLDFYPIKSSLHPNVYDIDAAQKRFSAETMIKAPNSFRLIFEFAPFKVFNANQTLNYIKKGNASIYVDEESEASRYLIRSSKISEANLLISKAIKSAIDKKLHKANSLLKEALKSFPNHSILHYNLALTYAQMGNFSKSYEHFLRSYHLDSTNYLSAIFALMSQHFTGVKISRVEKFIQEDFKHFDNQNTKHLFLKSLLYFYQGDISAATKWLQVNHDNKPLYLLLDILIAANHGNWQSAKKSISKLKSLLKDDILANLLFLEIHYKDLGAKEFSAKSALFLKNSRLNLDSVYYGSSFTRESYIALRFITGTLYEFKKRSEEMLLKVQKDNAGIIEALALSNIYLKKFEEAYTLFNQLIDEYKKDDSRTLFLAAVASIGADHPANAVALLELAKLNDPNNLESRYALGLLYLEQKNYEAAAIQFFKIPNGVFKSEYFDFKITGVGKE